MNHTIKSLLQLVDAYWASSGDDHLVVKGDLSKALQEVLNEHDKKLDALLAHCPDGECGVCAEIICPHGDGMHFHHDGCPACAELGDEV